VRESEDDQLAYSDVSISMSNSQLSVEQLPLEKCGDHQLEGDCWKKLLNNFVIAKMPSNRSEGLGMEMSFGDMVTFAGVRYEIKHDKRLSALLGFSTLLIPTKRLQNGIQWHLEVFEKLEMFEQLESCEHGYDHTPFSLLKPEVDKWLECDVTELSKQPVFLGWNCEREVQVQMGTSNLSTNDTQDSATEETERFALDSIEPFASLGFNIKGFVAQIGVRLIYKKQQTQFPHSEIADFGTILDSGRREESMLVYDTQSRRCWLVPKLSVLLHMAHYRKHTLNAHQELPKVPLAQASWDGGNSAKTAVEGVIDSPAQDKLRSYMMKIWGNLGFAQAKIAQDKRKKRNIHGVDFIEMADPAMSGKSFRKLSLNRSAGGWQYLCRRGLWVVFASSVGEVIEPTAPPAACRVFRLPKDNDYLGTTTASLRAISAVMGGDKNLDKVLTLNPREKVCRHTPKCYFMPKHRINQDCSCVRLQTLKKQRMDWSRPDDERLADIAGEGGIVIGTS
jgi:hypothetical protein